MHAFRLTVVAALSVLLPLGAHAQQGDNKTTAPVQGTQAEAVKRGTAAPAQAAQAAPATQGNPEAGAMKNGMCTGCHAIPGYQTGFPTTYKVPKIVGQSPKYIEAALLQYRKGERSHPTMRGIAGSLTDQDILDLAAYYGTNK